MTIVPIATTTLSAQEFSVVGERASRLVKGSLDTGLFFMPGRRSLSCDLIVGRYADDASGSMVTQLAHDIKATFEAPADGDHVDVYYVVDGAMVGAVVRTSRY